MKAKKKVPQKTPAKMLRLTSDARTVDSSETALFSLEGLPESGLGKRDVPRKLRTITQEELGGVCPGRGELPHRQGRL